MTDPSAGEKKKGRLGYGFKVGHWTHPSGDTGCTVIIPPVGNTASCDIRGASPGSRELAQLHPDRRHTEIHAVVFSGGSAFGLAAAQGVMEWLAERDIGYQTPVATIPIVPAAVVFDMAVARSEKRPGPEQGRAACEAASDDDVDTGRVGAGAGATVGKWAGIEYLTPGGIGIGRAQQAEYSVSAIAVANAVGDVLAEDGSVLAGTTSPDPRLMVRRPPEQKLPTNTVLALVATDAPLDKRAVRWLAARGSDGVTKTVRPAHTQYDGDITFAVAAPRAGGSPPELDILGPLATDAVAAAVRNAVARAE
jgi:L-aminopeptidase/D-esterase-like protein